MMKRRWLMLDQKTIKKLVPIMFYNLHDTVA